MVIQHIRTGSTGSPPHTWRIQHLKFVKSEVMRITSTHVENTGHYQAQYVPTKDHLHTRGEYLISITFPRSFWGSPPHTWRIYLGEAVGLGTNGITSTHVENTNWLLHWKRQARDHLHTRGEYENVLPRIIPDMRITSTHVENTIWWSIDTTVKWDHLHTRGEYWYP